MFLTRVLIGRFTAGNSAMVRPPPIDASNAAKLYDSVVDNTGNPSVFVAFENDQSYPAYLMTYKD
jgi:poly [ADP-ribose] polymerase 10/14/15